MKIFYFGVFLLLVVGGSFSNDFACLASLKDVNKSAVDQKEAFTGTRQGISDKAEAYYHFSLARTLEESGDFAKAIDEYKKAIQKDSRSATLYVEFANAFFRHRRVREAIQEAENAVRVNSDSLEAHKLLGTIYVSVIGNEESNRSLASNDTLKKAIGEYEIIGRLDPSDSGALLTLARLYRYDGQTDRAVNTLKQLLGAVPSLEAGLINLAQIYKEQENFKDAISLFKQALELTPDSPRILAELAYTYQLDKDYENAVETYRKAIEVDEDGLDLRKELAKVLYLDSRDEEAEKEFLKVLEADPDEGEAYLRLGQISRRRHDYERALEYFNKAGSILVGNVEVYYYLATLYEELGKFEKAEERFQQLLKLTEKPAKNYSPPEIQNRSIFLTHAGYISQQLEKFPQAVTYFSELKSLSPANAPKAEGYIIDTYRVSRQMDRAVTTCEAALKENLEDKDLRITCADVTAESGNSDQAIKALEKMLLGSEDDLKVYTAIVQIYQRDKKFKEAEKVLLNSEKSFKNKESFLFMRGALYERQKEYEKAEEIFNRILAIQPKHAASLNYLGYMWADRGVKLEESLELIKKAVELEPNNGAYLDSLGWVYFKLSRIEEAEDYLKKALDRVRKDPTIHEHLGDLYYRKGQYEEARASWELSLSYNQDDEEIKKVQKKVDELKVKLASAQKK